ncbi:malate dehydrogenase, partial [Candidatus Omnitrophota bacterium]
PIIVVVTNPLDIMAHIVYKETGLDPKRVIGMAGLLDSSRMNLMVSRAAKKSLGEVDSLVLGTHGATMAPITSHSRVGTEKLSDTLSTDEVNKILDATKGRGAEIVAYLGAGSAYYAPSAGVFRMVKAIVNDTKEILPCSCFLQGSYGFNNIYLGVPAKIGRDGVEEIIELDLTENETALLKAAADSVAKKIASL